MKGLYHSERYSLLFFSYKLQTGNDYTLQVLKKSSFVWGGPEVLQAMLWLHSKTAYDIEIVRDFQSTLRCCPRSCCRLSRFWKALWYSKEGSTWSCEFTVLTRSWISKLVSSEASFQSKKTAKSHKVLHQGRRVDGAGLVIFLPPDAELWPLLCREQHCHGVTVLVVPMCAHCSRTATTFGSTVPV